MTRHNPSFCVQMNPLSLSPVLSRELAKEIVKSHSSH